MCQVWCSGIQGIYAQLKGGYRYICIVLYIYRSAIRFAKFGVVVIKASMLNCKGGQVVIGICALFYIYRSAKSCAKFGVAVFKASMLDWRGDIDQRYICIVLYIYIDLPLDLPSLV